MKAQIERLIYDYKYDLSVYRTGWCGCRCSCNCPDKDAAKADLLEQVIKHLEEILHD